MKWWTSLRDHLHGINGEMKVSRLLKLILFWGLVLTKPKYRLYAEKKGLILPENLDRNPYVRRGIRFGAYRKESF